MAITNWHTLKSTVESYLDRSDMGSAVEDAIQFGENRIYRDVRVQDLEGSLSATISSGTIDVPSDYIEMKNLYIDTDPVQALQRKDLSFIYENHPTRSADSKPTFFAREGNKFIFGPFPDSNYAVKGIYYKKLEHLSNTNNFNFMINDFPELLLFAALVECEPFLQNDERIVVWESKYQAAVKQIQDQAETESLSGSPLAVTAA